MINEESLRAVDAAGWIGSFIKPLYESYCFSQIPQLIRHALTGAADASPAMRLLGGLDVAGRYDTVVLLLVDAFGWTFVEQYLDRHPFLQHLARDGVVTKLTSQFPSTTAAHMTAIHTGLPVGQSGVYEWFYYEPLVDRVIAPLLYSFAGDEERNTLSATGIAPERFYPPQTLYQDLAASGVHSTVFMHDDYALSPYTATVCRGAQIVSFTTVSEALVMLADALDRPHRPSYCHAYFGDIDTIGHRHGPASAAMHAEIEAFLSLLERSFRGELAGRSRRTLFLMTADHGQVDVDPATTIYLNRVLPRLGEELKSDRVGHPLAPAGSARDMFLYVRDDRLDSVHALLQKTLSGQAGVYRVADLIAQGFFGVEPPSRAFLERAGNLVILPHDNQTVWWYEPGRFDMHHFGSHGGLTRPEMEIALLGYLFN